MKSIVILKDIPHYRGAIQAIAPGWEIIFTKDRDMAVQHLPQAEIVVGWSSAVNTFCLQKASPLKWIQYWYTGVDDLPLEAIKERGVILTNAGGVHARPVSESVFADLLAIARLVPQSLAAQKEKQWEQKKLMELPHNEIHGKTIGILGTGYIGQEIARIARAFSMHTLGYNRGDGPVPYFDTIYTGDQLLSMLAQCDYVVNILPLTSETRGLIGRDAFASMKNGAQYYNFGRGETTDTAALIEALQSGHLSAAGLDVTDPEPLPSDSPLWGMDNVLISPHISGSTPYYTDRIMDVFMDNLENYVAGKPLKRNVINLERQY